MSRTLAGGIGGAAAILGTWSLSSGDTTLAYLSLTIAFGALCFGASWSLNWQILAGTLLGIACGYGFEDAAPAMKSVGRVFIFGLKMWIAPMILLSIMHGIANMGAARDLGRIGSRTLLLYMLTMAAAVTTGLVLVNVFTPGAESSLLESEFFQQAIGSRPPPDARPGLGEFLLTTVFQILSNPFDSLVNGRILPIVMLAILLGVALLQLGESARGAVDMLGSLYQAVMKIIGWFIRLAPIGIFALVGHLIATIGFRAIVENLAAFSGVVIGGTLFHALVTLPAFAWYLAGITPRNLFGGIREALVVAFTTSSSAATLPITTRCVEDNLGVPSRVSSFVLPLGATVNMDGTALYEAIAAIFVANLYGIDLSVGSQLVVFFVAMATAIGAPGIPSAGMVTMIVVLESVGLPAESVGLLLTIDRLLDTFRTMTNVAGDAVVAACIAHAEAT